MRASASVVVLAVALPAHADLYRWIDPESGSVKFSSQRPLDTNAHAEVIPFAQTNPAGARPIGVATSEYGQDPAAGASMLESRLQQLISQLAGVTRADFERGGDGLRQQAEAYEAVRAELDRIDPAGAARRRQSAPAGILERLRKGLGAQFNPGDPLRK